MHPSVHAVEPHIGATAVAVVVDHETPDGTSVFVSDEKAGGRDRFEFADGHMTSGTFVRADGKAFPVRRISGRSE